MVMGLRGASLIKTAGSNPFSTRETRAARSVSAASNDGLVLDTRLDGLFANSRGTSAGNIARLAPRRANATMRRKRVCLAILGIGKSYHCFLMLSFVLGRVSQVGRTTNSKGSETPLTSCGGRNACRWRSTSGTLRTMKTPTVCDARTNPPKKYYARLDHITFALLITVVIIGFPLR